MEELSTFNFRNQELRGTQEIHNNEMGVLSRGFAGAASNEAVENLLAPHTTFLGNTSALLKIASFRLRDTNHDMATSLR